MGGVDGVGRTGHQGGHVEVRSSRRSPGGSAEGWGGAERRSWRFGGAQRRNLRFTVHSGRPQRTLRGTLDLRGELGLEWVVGPVMGVGFGLRFALLLLLQEDLVVQKLKLSRVPVDGNECKQHKS